MNQKRRRLTLYKRNPHCHWCGTKTVLPPPGPPPTSKPMPPNMATIDHLRDKYHPKRHERPRPGEERTVLACNRCNGIRNTERQAECIELHRAHSMHGHYSRLAQLSVRVADVPLAPSGAPVLTSSHDSRRRLGNNHLPEPAGRQAIEADAIAHAVNVRLGAVGGSREAPAAGPERRSPAQPQQLNVSCD